MQGTIALVTGAGSGLGAAIARRLAADGAHIVVNDLNEDAAQVVAKEVDGEVRAFDVGDSAAFDAAVDDVVAAHGKIDVLVNNAGIVNARREVLERGIANQMAAMSGGEMEPTRATSTLSDEQWDRAIKTHLYGTFYGTRAALRHMEPARSGAIVNLASLYGYRGQPGGADYAAAKHAIIGFTRSVGMEVAAFGIRVNAVAPGFIDTPLLDPMEDLKPFIVGQIASRRLGRAEDVAELVRFLAGPEAAYCMGDTLPLSGGYGL
jgi:NAD(P)-dependent dehydrogenase (short-subunit alcohol dehydrogenase family)